jgi:hypothetical protein
VKNVIDVPALCGLATLLVRPVIVTGPDVCVGDDTGADGGVTGSGADPSLTLKGTDVFTLPTSAVVVASRAQTTTRCPPAVVGLHVYVFEELQLRTTVEVVPWRTNHLN